MNEYVTDTMALVLRLEKRRLGELGASLFARAEAGEVRIYVPSLSLAEILYLHEKQRIETGVGEVFDYFSTYSSCREHPLDRHVIQTAGEITDIKELHDRLIAATARVLKLPLLTNDPVIRSSAFVECVW